MDFLSNAKAFTQEVIWFLNEKQHSLDPVSHSECDRYMQEKHAIVNTHHLPGLRYRSKDNHQLKRNICLAKHFFKMRYDQGFVRVLENLESHGILFFAFPGLESHGILCRVMESHGKLHHFKKL